MQVRTWITVLPLLAIFATATPAETTAETTAEIVDLSGVLKEVLAPSEVPGMVGAIVTSAGVQAHGAAGVSKRGSDDPVLVSDPFHLGSCTKSMTASLVAMLVAEGKLEWDATPDAKHEDWKGATLAMFCSNRSGAATEIERDLWASMWKQDGKDARAARQELAAGVLGAAPKAKPGTELIYSNAGFTIAGSMAENAVDVPFEELMKTRLFEPLDMKSAGFGAPPVLEDRPGPVGHRADGEPVAAGFDNPSAISPAGRVHAAIDDWGKYIAWHLRAGRGEGELLDEEEFALLHQTPMGWVAAERPWGGGRVLTHSGSNTAWFCVVWMAPARDFAVLVACNQGGDAAAKTCDSAASALIRFHLKAVEDR